jgi:hypothetical protein
MGDQAVQETVGPGGRVAAPCWVRNPFSEMTLMEVFSRMSIFLLGPFV